MTGVSSGKERRCLMSVCKCLCSLPIAGDVGDMSTGGRLSATSSSSSGSDSSTGSSSSESSDSESDAG